MEALTLDRAVELAREVVAEFGEDYVYPESHKRLQWEDEPESPSNPMSCVYVHEGKPSCIVGHILHRHGVEIEAMKNHEFDSACPVSGATTNAEGTARFFLREMQEHQDKGKPWGESLEFGLEQTRMCY